MAEYFNKFSFTFPCDRTQYLWLVNFLLECKTYQENHRTHQITEEFKPLFDGEFKMFLSDSYFDFPLKDYIAYSNEAWVISNNSLDIDSLTYVIQRFMINFDIDSPISFEWTTTCNKQAVGAFRGGSIVIFKDKVYSDSGNEYIGRVLRSISPDIKDRFTKEHLKQWLDSKTTKEDAEGILLQLLNGTYLLEDFQGDVENAVSDLTII